MGDNDRSQLENKAKVKIMTTAFIEREVGGGDFSYCRRIQHSEFFLFFVLFCFFSQLYLCR